MEDRNLFQKEQFNKVIYSMAKLQIDGHSFKNEEEYRWYRGLRELHKEGKIEKLEVNPEYPLSVFENIVATYTPTFCFYNTLKQQRQVIQVMKNKSNPALELKIKLFEALYGMTIERW